MVSWVYLELKRRWICFRWYNEHSWTDAKKKDYLQRRRQMNHQLLKIVASHFFAFTICLCVCQSVQIIAKRSCNAFDFNISLLRSTSGDFFPRGIHNSKFYGGQKHNTTNFSFSFSTWDRSPRIQFNENSPTLTFSAGRNNRDKVWKKRRLFDSDLFTTIAVVSGKAPYKFYRAWVLENNKTYQPTSLVCPWLGPSKMMI